jgi:phage terminase large subunit-like protein
VTLELPNAEEIDQLLRTMSKEGRAELVRRVQTIESGGKKVWFCKVGRSCDGEPHPGADYPHARGNQWPPPGTDWLVWAMIAGRGGGKTRSGAEYTRQASHQLDWIGIVGPTNAAVRDIQIEGESGLIAVCERAGEPCVYEPSKRRVTFHNGSRAQLFSAEEPKRLRGPQHTFIWADEPAHWDNIQDVWDMMMFGLRLKPRPHVLLTTTPLPSDWMKEIIADEKTVTTRYSTYDNIRNLAEPVARLILNRYEGTYLGRQEIHGEIIDDRVGALWSSQHFQYVDVATRTFERIVVGVDPAGSAGKRSDETGIIVCGLLDGALYVLADYTGKFSPQGWAEQVKIAYARWNADAVVVERNYGGDMVRNTLTGAGYDGRIVEAHATDGKKLRAEPVAAFYERGEAFHARSGGLEKLETEMVSWIPGEGRSPNRVDALVWCATELKRNKRKAQIASPVGLTLNIPRFIPSSVIAAARRSVLDTRPRAGVR